jgi:hypothetical protein
MLYLKRLCTTQFVNNATNCSFFFSLSLSTQHVSALNGDLQVSYYANAMLILVQYSSFSIVRHLKKAILGRNMLCRK